MSNHSAEQFEAIQAVVDRVGAYQDGAPEGTVETELTQGLSETGVELEPAEVTRLVEAIEAGTGTVDAASVLG